MLLLIIGALLVGAAFAIGGRALVMARHRTVASVTGIERYGFTSPSVMNDVETRTALEAVASFVGETVGKRLGVFGESQLRQQLISAGMYSLSPRMLFSYQLIATVGLTTLWLWLSISGGGSGVIVVLGTAVALAVGWYGPVSIVRRKARERLGEIDYALPELI